MTWMIIKNWIHKNWKNLLVALFALVMIVGLANYVKSAKPKVFIIGPSEKVQVKIK